jgi:hypothetical protein
MDCSSCSGEGGWDRSGMPGRLSRPDRREDRLSEDEEESDPPRGMEDVAAAAVHVECDVLLLLLPMVDLLR